MSSKRRRSIETTASPKNNSTNNVQKQDDVVGYEKTSSKRTTGTRLCVRLQHQWSLLSRRVNEDSWKILCEGLKGKYTCLDFLLGRSGRYNKKKGKERNPSTTTTRMVLRLVVIVIGILLFTIHLYDGMFYQLGGLGGGTLGGKFQQQQQQQHSDEYFAVAINTYKRPDRLKHAVQHYADTCGKQAGVAQVFIIWAEQGTMIPQASSFFESTSSSSSSNLRNSNSAAAAAAETVENTNRAYVKVLQKTKDSLNSRFEPIDELDYDAVFMVDDDIRVDCSSLSHGFQAWRKRPFSMVGYYPRLASPPRSTTTSDHTSFTTTSSTPPPPLMIYHTWPIVYLKHKFNFVLTKASFLHAKYLALYTDDLPQEVRDHVDKHKNCEDIAMSMLVANYTKSTNANGEPTYPIYVEGNVDDTGLFGGISTGSGHMVTRSDCLTTLTEIFHKKGWESPLAYEIPLRENSWVRHAPGFWWQSKPSNFFEWISFANMFT